MALTFLCSVHREWVYFHPQEALSYLEDAQQKGESYLQHNDWKEALPFLGCAFETVEILLELQGSTKPFLITRITSLALLLANAFDKLNADKYRHTVLARAEQKLLNLSESLSNDNAKTSFVGKCLLTIRTSAAQYSLKQPLAQAPLVAQVH